VRKEVIMRYVNVTFLQKDIQPHGQDSPISSNISRYWAARNAQELGNSLSLLSTLTAAKKSIRRRRTGDEHKDGNLHERDYRSLAEAMLDEIIELVMRKIALLKATPDTYENAGAHSAKLAQLNLATKEKAAALAEFAEEAELEIILPLLEKLLGSDHPIIARIRAKLSRNTEKNAMRMAKDAMRMRIAPERGGR
jgi:hypothetical protein